MSSIEEIESAIKKLPKEIQNLADKNFALLKENPNHPSLHFKKNRELLFYKSRDQL